MNLSHIGVQGWRLKVRFPLVGMFTGSEVPFIAGTYAQREREREREKKKKKREGERRDRERERESA